MTINRAITENSIPLITPMAKLNQTYSNKKYGRDLAPGTNQSFFYVAGLAVKVI